MPNTLKRGWNWCRRFRHRKGYGVHSPSDFYLITFVIYEKGAYYAYHPLHELRKQQSVKGRCCREKTDKLLFRLANYQQPNSILEIGTGSGIDSCYLSAGRQCPLITLDEPNQPSEGVKDTLSHYPQITLKTGELLSLLEKEISRNGLPTLIHLAHTEHYEACFERMLPHVTPRTCIIVNQPHATAAKRKWWKSVIKDKRTGVTFDLYDIGIIFFDPKRVKEHRIVNFL